MITFAIDASTYIGTAAVLHDGQVVAEGAAAMRGRESEALMPCVADVLQRAHVAPSDLDRIVCGAGPGSFTSLRIAASIAKGLAWATDRPLLAISSLALILTADGLPKAGRWLTALDALRGESYVEAFEVRESGDVEVIPTRRIVAHGELASLTQSLGASLAGPDQAFNRSPHARGLSALEPLIVPVDLGTWQPAYGRKAEAQVRWEMAHDRALPSA